MASDVDVRTITTTERRYLKRCPKKWWWAFRDGLRNEDVDLKLWFGSGIHVALARRYGPGMRRRRDFIEKFEAYCDEDPFSRFIKADYNGDGADVWGEAKALGVGMLNHYREHYGNDRDWDIVYIEEPFRIEIPHPDDQRQTVGVFASAFDGVCRDRSDGDLKLIEHKTAKAISTLHLENDEQAGSYLAIATQILRHRGVLGPRDRLTGIVYNYLRKALSDDPRPMNAQGLYLNKDGSVSKQQPSPFFARPYVERTLHEQASQIISIGHDLMYAEALRNGTVPIFKNRTRDCYWECEFAKMCEMHDQRAEWQEYRDSIFRVRDPYAHLRKGTEG